MAKIDERVLRKWILPDPARILRDPVIWEALNQQQQKQIFKNEIEVAIETAKTTIRQAEITIKQAKTIIKQQQNNIKNLKMAQSMIKEKG